MVEMNGDRTVEIVKGPSKGKFSKSNGSGIPPPGAVSENSQVSKTITKGG